MIVWRCVQELHLTRKRAERFFVRVVTNFVHIMLLARWIIKLHGLLSSTKLIRVRREIYIVARLGLRKLLLVE